MTVGNYTYTPILSHNLMLLSRCHISKSAEAIRNKNNFPKEQILPLATTEI